MMDCNGRDDTMWCAYRVYQTDIKRKSLDKKANDYNLT